MILFPPDVYSRKDTRRPTAITAAHIVVYEKHLTSPWSR
jgi:hypothetical protein